MSNHIEPQKKIFENIKTCIHFSTKLIKAVSVPTLPGKAGEGYAFELLL